MSDLRELYQEVILDHNRRPRNFRELENPTGRVEGVNPLCGDHLTVFVRVNGDIVEDVSFVGSGCAISRASASLMTESVKGKTLVAAHERDLLEYATRTVAQVPGVRLIGTAPRKAAVLSFVLDGIHPHDVGTVLDREGVAVRTGHHCCQPLMRRFGVAATARASLAFYNTFAEVDALVASLRKVVAMFADP